MAANKNEPLAVGDLAPNFDLTSTEDVVLMLCDEVPRTAVLLYFFGDPDSDQTRSDLESLATAAGDLMATGVKVFGVSPAKMLELKAKQRELGLPFALLQDDREFASDFGARVSADAAEGAGTGDSVLVLVGRDRRVLWQANPCGAVSQRLEQLSSQFKKLSSSTANYPRSVINRLVDLWVN